MFRCRSEKKTVVIFRYLFAVFFRFMLLWFPYAVLIKGGGGSARLPVIVGEMNCLLLQGFVNLKEWDAYAVGDTSVCYCRDAFGLVSYMP